MDADVVTSEDNDAHLEVRHIPLRPKHAHSHVHRNLKRKREPMAKRQVQTALDVIVVSGGTTAGDVLLASIPNEPTTASLPGFGLLTISTFIPGTPTTATPSTTPTAATTGSAASQSSLAPTAAATLSSLTPSMTGLNSTISSSSSQTSMMYNVGVATSYNGTSASTASPYSNSSMASTTFSGTSSSASSSFTSFATSTSAASASASSTTGGGIIGGGAGSPTGTTGSQPTADAGSGNSNSSNSMAGPIAGGVVGGIAGAALIAVLLILLLRLWRKRQDRGQPLVGSPADEEGTSPAGAGPSPAMTQRSSLAPIAAAIHRFRPASTQTAASSSTAGAAAPAERGFQRLGGRKLTSVLQSGGDGYGEPAGRPDSLVPPPVAYRSNRESDLSGTSFLRDSNSHYGGGNTNSQQYNSNPFEDAGASAAVRSRNMQPAPSDSSVAAHASASNRGSSIYDAPRTGNPFVTPDARADRALQAFSSSPGSTSSDGVRSPTPDINETLTVHQGPIRTPVITGAGSSTPPIPPRRPGHGVDGLGRSRPSWDGSRHSRFSEAI